MKIGGFANKNNISKDAIRHYMDLGLVIPEKQGGQYFFDEKCQRDLNEILKLKDMGFKLNEIKTIFLFNSLGNLTCYQQDEYYKALFMNKHKEILNEIDKLKIIEKNIRKTVDKLEEYKGEKNFELGIDISVIDILKCHKCKGKLCLEEGEIKNNEILNGKLKCSCGEQYKIEEGILIGETSCNEPEFSFDYNYISEYINVTDYNYLDSVYKGIDWVNKKIDFQKLQKKVILDLGSGVGFVLRNIYDKLPDDCLYIAVDHDIKRHKFLKNMLERTSFKKKVIFICTDFSKIPLRDKIADVSLDFSGTSNYGFEHKTFLLNIIDNYIKDNAYLIGAYIIFKNFRSNSVIEERYRKNFVLENIKRDIDNLGYKAIDENRSDYLESGGKYEDYFVEGEKVYNYVFYGER